MKPSHIKAFDYSLCDAALSRIGMTRSRNAILILQAFKITLYTCDMMRTFFFLLLSGSTLTFFFQLIGFSRPAVATSLTLGTGFDSFSEGTTRRTITDVGITFSNLDRYLSQDEGYSSFVIESTDGSGFDSSFSPPNYLTTSGYAPGPGHSFGRFGSARITFGEALAFETTMDIFSGSSSNILTLEALRDGDVVAKDSIAFNFFGQQQKLSISGILFDEMRLVASGFGDDTAVFIGIDNVNVKINTIPESNFITGLVIVAGLGGTVLKRANNKSKKS